MSSVLKLVAISLFFTLFVRMITKSSITTNQTRSYIDLDSTRDTYNISDDDLGIGFNFYQYTNRYNNLSDYFEVSSRKFQTRYDYNTSQQRLTFSDHQIDIWDQSVFSNYINGFGNTENDILWIDNNNLTVSNNRFMSSSEYVDLLISRWNNQTQNCASMEETNRLINTIDVRLFLKNKYFDFNDLETPVKNFIQVNSLELKDDNFLLVTITVK